MTATHTATATATTDYERLDAWVDAHFDEEVQFLQELVRVLTATTPRTRTEPPNCWRVAGLRDQAAPLRRHNNLRRARAFRDALHGGQHSS